MRRTLAFACLFALLAFAPAVMSAFRYGSAGPNTLRRDAGGRQADRIRWPDRIDGRGGGDTINGGGGNDRIRPGWDAPGELVDCGPGYDWVILGPGDRQRKCERVTRHGIL